jgi:IS30 family transposase
MGAGHQREYQRADPAVLPQGRDLTTITQQEIDTDMERLNTRPRKRLGFLTHSQVFFASGVALQI